MANNLKKLTCDGIKWQISVTAANRVFSCLAMLILARFLGPSVFGLYALTIAIVNSFELFKSMGLDTALIRRRDDCELAADTAFFIIPALGLILYVAMAFSAPAISAMFKASEVAVTVPFLGIAFLCNCFTRVPSALLERRMEFKKLSIAEAVTNFIFPVIAVAMALAGCRVWSLVAAYVLKMIVYMVMVWRYAQWRPSWRFSPAIAAEMFSFGKFIFLASVVFFLKMNLDNILVGKYLGVTMLGLYALAFNIANFSADYFGSKVYRVVYAAYSAIDRDDTRLVEAMLKTLKFLAMVALPVGVGIIMLGDDFLNAVYGAKWLAAGNALKILALAGIFNTLPVAMTPVFLAKGKSFIGFITMSVQVAIFFLLIRPFAAWMGIRGVSIVVAAASFIGMALSFAFMYRLLGVTPAQYGRCFAPAAFSTAAMASVIAALKGAVLLRMPLLWAPVVFVVITLAAVAIYGLVLVSMEKSLLKEIREAVL